MHLPNKYFQLIIALRNNPLASLSQLGEALSVSPNSVKAWIAQMKDKGILRKDAVINDPVFGKRNTTEVVAQHNPSSLGLTRLNVLIYDIKGLHSYRQIVSYLDEHPYTTYRAMGMSNRLSIYCQFDIPQGAIDYLNEFLLRMKSFGLFGNYQLFQPQVHRSFEDDLTKWDPETQRWRLSINKTKDEGEPSLMVRLMQYLDQEYHWNDLIRPQDPVSKFDELDLMLLRELTINAKVRIKDIVEHYQKDPATLSRRLNKIRSTLVAKNTLLYDRSLFGLDSVFVLSGKLFKREANALMLMFDQYSFPFKSYFGIDTECNFVWFIQTSMGTLHELIQFLLPISEDLQQLTIDPSTGFRYYFYHLNFDHQSKQWRSSFDYMCPIKS